MTKVNASHKAQQEVEAVEVEETTTDLQENLTPKPEHKEGKVARAIENETAKLPSDLFLWTAGAAVVASAALQFTGKQKASNFVGLWVPSILIVGLYNKLVKVAGSH